MTEPHSLSKGAQLYIASVILVGGTIATSSVVALVGEGARPAWLVLAVLTLASGSFTVRIPTIPARLSVSETFVFAAVLMFGPAAATVIVVLDTLVISFWLGRRANPLSRLLFNVAAPATAIWISAEAFYWVTQIEPMSVAPQPILPLAFPLLGLAILYFLLNSWFIAFAVAFQKRRAAVALWRENFLWLSLNYFSGASVAALLLPYLLQVEYVLPIVGFLLPLLLISYLTLRTALGRVEDANKHLEELNRLYLSTIETLAMAIDAKDQITHGHIRRVQRYAVRLAAALGVNDAAQIKAIEAASLLHDMGKLAVPEYILNKPGKLTSAEFDRMKSHARVGADILSSIDFPYPVVPIVRHHHENWDGSGYPDGLIGTDIPIGARILSVVDCFDALTSDRPYRPRLSDTDAVNILLERRGKMYDPLIVDSFIKIHGSVSLETQLDLPPALASTVDRLRLPDSVTASADPVLDHIAASAEESLVLYDLAIDLSGVGDSTEMLGVASGHLRRLMPVHVCALYSYSPERDDLFVEAATGEASARLIGLRIPRGQRLSGWVAANLKTIVNSDPVLDLGDVARSMKPRLVSCLSSPVLLEKELMGVFSLYSFDRNAFDENDRRVVELVSKQIAKISLRWAPTKNTTPVANPRHSSNAEAERPLLQMAPALGLQGQVLRAVLLVSIRSGSGGDNARPAALAEVLEALRASIRGSDAVVPYGDEEIVVLLAATASGSAEIVMERITDSLSTLRVSGRIAERLAVGVGSAPLDGASADLLVVAARRRLRPLSGGTSASSVH
jgi:putative nucleotidyltransferase with HDIG domain